MMSVIWKCLLIGKPLTTRLFMLLCSFIFPHNCMTQALENILLTPPPASIRVMPSLFPRRKPMILSLWKSTGIQATLCSLSALDWKKTQARTIVWEKFLKRMNEMEGIRQYFWQSFSVYKKVIVLVTPALKLINLNLTCFYCVNPFSVVIVTHGGRWKGPGLTSSHHLLTPNPSCESQVVLCLCTFIFFPTNSNQCIGF